jgi:hypothetical protein
MLEIVIGFLFTLATGSYAWSALIYKWLSEKIDKIESNHLKHIEDRLRKLEGIDCPYKENDSE